MPTPTTPTGRYIENWFKTVIFVHPSGAADWSVLTDAEFSDCIGLGCCLTELEARRAAGQCVANYLYTQGLTNDA